MIRLRHSARLLRDIASYTATFRSWWMLPLMVALFALMALATAGQTLVPVTMYTLF